MRHRIYRMVHIYNGNPVSVIYKYVMMALIALSLVPLTMKEPPAFCTVIETVCLITFTLDFLLRWFTADLKFGKSHWTSFVRYPFRLISLIDLLSLFALATSLFGWFAGLGIAKALSVFRLVRVFRYSKNIRVILTILHRSKKPLIAVGSLAVGYILISAIIIFNVEPDSFHTFFDAIYWSTVSLTTVGYGDIYPVTTVGRTIAMLSSFFGIAIVALPAGIVTAGYLSAVNESDEPKE